MEQQLALARPAIRYEPDGYRTDIDRLMGRQSAGLGFLRAAVDSAQGRVLVGFSPHRASGENFERTVKEIAPDARAAWLPPARPDLLAQIGHLYLPGPGLTEYAQQRMRFGHKSWSLTGVTHTTASHGAMDSLIDLLTAPVMPWDALVCTSAAVKSTVDIVLRAQWDYLKWRFGAATPPPLPQLPVIPLGVHCKDFESTKAQRTAARKELGIGDDEVVALFVGRLAFHAKAHPAAMFEGLQAAARRTGRKLVLVQCGWFANQHIESAFRECSAALCPDVRCLYTDGRSAAARAGSWAAADMFVSLSDNIQETFGLTPVEAMAAGLPVVVTDWDGYRDTVRDGVDGFRIATWAPRAGTGDGLALAHEMGQDHYDMYCGLACQHVAVDPAMLADRLSQLAANATLRRKLGKAGRERARSVFDWSVVYRSYESLWAELDRIRGAAKAEPAPRVAASRLDPFITFGHYPTRQVGPATRVRRRDSSSPETYAALSKLSVYSFAQRVMPGQDLAVAAWNALAAGPVSVAELATVLQIPEGHAIRAAAVFAKVGLVELEA